MEVDQRARFVSRCLIRAVALSVVLDAMKPVAAWCNLFLLLSHTKHYYTLYLTTEVRGEKVGCVAA